MIHRIINMEGARKARERVRKPRTQYPEIRGSVEDQIGAIAYEVLQVGNGHALVWTERSHPALEPTASGGFGWIEPLGSSFAEAVDLGRVRSTIERRLRSQLPSRLIRTA